LYKDDQNAYHYISLYTQLPENKLKKKDKAAVEQNSAQPQLR
jgi:hypothetical protein